MDKLLTLLLIVFLLSQTWIAAAFAAQDPSYVSNVQEERQRNFREIFISNYVPEKKTKLYEVIFNPQLSKEFKDQYRSRFGELDSESMVYMNSRTKFVENPRTLPLDNEKENLKRREFSEYMIKRLSEWHVDNYVKTEPAVRPLYETKERLSHIEVKVTQEVKVDFKYDLAANNLDLILINPWVDFRWAVEMDRRAFGPSSAVESKLKIEKQITSDLRLRTQAALIGGIASLEFEKQLPKNWGLVARTSTFFKDNGDPSRETKYLLGLGTSY
jgi:hypothetical protein